MSVYKVTVAHYGHIRLPGAWHYTIMLHNQPESCKEATAYQITRAEGKRTFEFKDPQSVNPGHTNSYQGELVVGQIPATDAAVQHFGHICRLVPIINNSKDWNCQNWVAEVLQEMARVGLQIRGYDHATLAAAMVAVVPH